MTVVADANIIIALVVDDDRQSAVQGQMTDWFSAGESLHAPGVMPYEITNVLARRVYDGDLAASEATSIWSDVADLGIEFHPLDLDNDGPAIAEIATQLRRWHATDAAYVRLAVQLEADLWTLDGPLARNAASIGMPVKLLE